MLFCLNRVVATNHHVTALVKNCVVVPVFQRVRLSRSSRGRRKKPSSCGRIFKFPFFARLVFHISPLSVSLSNSWKLEMTKLTTLTTPLLYLPERCSRQSSTPKSKFRVCGGNEPFRYTHLFYVSLNDSTAIHTFVGRQIDSSSTRSRES